MRCSLAAQDAQELGIKEQKLTHPGEVTVKHHAGLWVVIGASDVDLLTSLQEVTQGKALIQGLCKDDATTNRLRDQLASAGLHPLITVETLRDS